MPDIDLRGNAIRRKSWAGHQVTPPQVAGLLVTLVGDMSRDKLRSGLGLLDRKFFRARYLAPALVDGLIEMTITDKPNSRLQKYG